MTQDGISFRVKGKHKSRSVSWEKIFGAAGLVDENEKVLIDSSKKILQDIGFLA